MRQQRSACPSLLCLLGGALHPTASVPKLHVMQCELHSAAVHLCKAAVSMRLGETHDTSTLMHQHLKTRHACSWVQVCCMSAHPGHAPAFQRGLPPEAQCPAQLD